MKIQLNAKDQSFEYHTRGREKILYAGLRHGLDLPYECGTGTCGTCRARLVEGDIDDPWPEAPGRERFKGDDEFLMCQCLARTDCVVEVPTKVGEVGPEAFIPDARRGTITRMTWLTHDVVDLDVEIDTPMDFDAGQFVVVEAPGIPGYRGYSMVNFERQTRRLRFVFKNKPSGGLSEWLFNTDPVGTVLDVVGPVGHAVFRPEIDKNLLCIAGGSGIAGIMSILSRAVQEDYFRSHKGYVFFGVRAWADAFYLDELSAFKETAPEDLHVVIAFSDEDVPAAASQQYPLLEFEHGFVHEVAAYKMEGSVHDIRAYLAGPPSAVDAARKMLVLQAKLSPHEILYDKFY